MAKYSKRASKLIDKTMKEFGRRSLRSGKNGRKVSARRQAIAIALGKARKRHYEISRQT